jgi:hypothetical protein
MSARLTTLESSRTPAGQTLPGVNGYISGAHQSLPERSEANFHVAALFVRSDSIYKLLGCDSFDLARPARTFKRDKPIVAHPPCRAWSALKYFARPRYGERRLAIWAVLIARRCGGVVEHPKGSSLWKTMKLPLPQEAPDQWGGYTIEVDQFNFGHAARKRTWLYIVGTYDLPLAPIRPGQPTAVCHQPDGARRKKERPNTSGRLPTLPQHEREATPRLFAEWLIEIAHRTRSGAVAPALLEYNQQIGDKEK